MLLLAAQMPGKHIMHFTLIPVNSLETIATETQYQASQEKKKKLLSIAVIIDNHSSVQNKINLISIVINEHKYFSILRWLGQEKQRV